MPSMIDTFLYTNYNTSLLLQPLAPFAFSVTKNELTIILLFIVIQIQHVSYELMFLWSIIGTSNGSTQTTFR